MTASSIYKRLGGAKVIKMPVKSDLDLFDLSKAGIPKATIKFLADSLSISEKELIDFLPVTPRNLQRYEQNELLNENLSDRIIALATLFELGEFVLGKNFFKEWLYLKNPALGGIKPYELLKTQVGIQLLNDTLLRIEHGVFA